MLYDSKPFVSPGSIGGKIKKYRELRGWTQKELGLRAGFAESSADVRIAQYEKNKRIPKENVLKDIAVALGIDETVFFDADLLDKNRMYHALFDIEDFHGLHPVKIGDAYYLEFSGKTILSPKGVLKYDSYAFLKKWYEKRQKYMPRNGETNEDKERKKTEYAIWRGAYPLNEAKEISERLRDQMRMDQLQAEMDALNAKMKSEDEMLRIEKALDEVKSPVLSSHKPIEKESDLIFLIKKTVENGLGIERFSPEETLEIDYDQMHLLSLRTEEILRNDSKKSLYADLVYGIEDICSYGINISQRIVSRKNELFISYFYPASQYGFFENLEKYWDDISDIMKRKQWMLEDDIDELERKFRDKITGVNDVAFSEELNDDE